MNPQSTTTQNFIQKAQQIHGDKYDYSQVVYINSQTSVKIDCSEHGDFIQKPSSHLKNKGCMKCS